MLLAFPESDVELERSYQVKHNKIDKEADSQVNGVTKNNKEAVKKQIPNNSIVKKSE